MMGVRCFDNRMALTMRIRRRAPVALAPKTPGSGPLTLLINVPAADNISVETEFRDAIRGLHATGASHSAQKVVKALSDHTRNEGELLESYRRVLDEELQPPAVRYLVQLILEDEERHHRVLEELANAIVWSGFRDGPDNMVPDIPTRYSCDEPLRTQTQELLNHELKDRVQLRRLRKGLRAYGHVAQWELLIDLMSSDTEKHIRILRFILSHGTNQHGFRRLLRRR
jgi:bacterioferritin (cytochrome b1)